MAFRIPVRYLVVLALCFVGLTTNVNRDNLYTTIVTMVPEVEVAGNTSTKSSNLCPHLSPPKDNRSQTSHADPALKSMPTYAKAGKFNWSPELQGIVIGCFFWTSCFCQVPSGYIADRYGGTLSIAVSLLATGLISIISPIATESSVWLLITFRVLLGVFQAGINPGMYVMVCNWIPLHERSTALAVTNAGSLISGIILPFSTGYLINNYTWKSMFYVPGIMSLIILILCAPFLRSKPENHPCVSAAELAVIRKKDPAEEPAIHKNRESTDKENKMLDKDPVPWISILTNGPVLATILLKFAAGISSYMMLSEAPTFFANVFYMDVSEISRINMINYIVYVSGMIASAKVSEELIVRGCLSRTNSRKLFSLFSGSIGAISVALIPFSRCNKLAVVVLVYFSALMESFCMASDIPLFAEMTNKFPGVLYAIFQVASLSPGFIAPMYSGLVLGYFSDQWLAWDIIFYSTSSFLIFANIVFIFFGSARVQSFDHRVRAEHGIANLVKHPSAILAFV